MPHFKSPDNKVHFLDSVEFISLLPSGSVEITDEEAANLTAPPLPTQQQVIDSYTAAIQTHIDDIAKTKGYDSILSACTYATSKIAKFKAEGQACVNYRDAVWSTSYQVLADVEAGTRTMPTIEALIAELPAIVWP
jgi:hypothetical protein